LFDFDVKENSFPLNRVSKIDTVNPHNERTPLIKSFFKYYIHIFRTVLNGFLLDTVIQNIER